MATKAPQSTPAVGLPTPNHFQSSLRRVIAAELERVLKKREQITDYERAHATANTIIDMVARHIAKANDSTLDDRINDAIEEFINFEFKEGDQAEALEGDELDMGELDEEADVIDAQNAFVRTVNFQDPEKTLVNVPRNLVTGNGGAK